MLQASRNKCRKLTDHGKQLLTRVLISNVIVFYDTERIMGNDMWVREVGKYVNSIKTICFVFRLLQLVRSFFFFVRKTAFLVNLSS